MMQKKVRKKRNAFTLTELTVVLLLSILVVALLCGYIAALFDTQSNFTKTAEATEELQCYKSQVVAFLEENDRMNEDIVLFENDINGKYGSVSLNPKQYGLSYVNRISVQFQTDSHDRGDLIIIKLHYSLDHDKTVGTEINFVYHVKYASLIVRSEEES